MSSSTHSANAHTINTAAVREASNGNAPPSRDSHAAVPFRNPEAETTATLALSRRQRALQQDGAGPAASRHLGPSNSLRVDSFRHFAGLLVAEKPLESHREYQRMHSEIQRAGIAPEAGPPPAAPPLVPAAAGTRRSASPAPKRAPARAPEAALGGIEASNDAEYEAYRRKFKKGYLYRIVRGQIMKNKHRRGRAGYLEHLKALYNGIVPSSGRRSPKTLSPGQRVLSMVYLACMLLFDAITPVLLAVSASLVTVFMITCMTFTTLFQAGLRQAWTAAINDTPLDDKRGLEVARSMLKTAYSDEKLWGPQRLWKRYVVGGEPIGDDLYRVEWGAVGPAVMKEASGSQAWRYIASAFVHASFKHFLLLAIATGTSAALVERRYGISRTAIMAIMFCITGSMAAMLSLEDCKITFGASPLAWGFTTWWAIDTGAKLTLYPWRNPVKLPLKTRSLAANLTGGLLAAVIIVFLLISDVALGVSSAAGAIAVVVSTLMIAPVFCPRWNRSLFEALTVPVAFAGVLLFWVIIPLAGAAKAASVKAADVEACSLTRLLREAADRSKQALSPAQG